MDGKNFISVQALGLTEAKVPIAIGLVECIALIIDASRTRDEYMNENNYFALMLLINSVEHILA